MDPKRLTRLLEEQGLVERLALDQALSKLTKGEALADRLVAQGTVREGDLLRAMAQALQVRFVSTPRLQDLQVSPEVLALIPAEYALEHAVLPVAFNAEGRTLAVVMADPAKLEALDDLPKVGALAHVVANVAMPSAIRAAVRRLHHLPDAVPDRPKKKPTGACPQCGEPSFPDQLECGCCGLLLNPNAPVDNSEVRIVRALLSEPTGVHRVRSRNQVHDGATRVGHAVEVKEDHVPTLAPGLAAVRSLAEFEAFVVSFVDGVATVAELAKTTGLTPVELQSVLASLVERRVLKLGLPEFAPPPPARAAVATPAPGSPAAAPRPPPAAAPTGLPTRPPTSPGMASPVAPPRPIPGKTQAAFVPGAAAAPAQPPARPESSPGVKAVPRHLRPEVQLENSLQAALQLERRGEIDGAVKVLEIAIARAPNPAPLYNRLALVMLNQKKDVGAAERYLKKAVALEPENPVWRENLRQLVMYAAAL